MDQHHTVNVLHGLAMVRVRLCNHGAKGVDWPAVRPPAVTCADLQRHHRQRLPRARPRARVVVEAPDRASAAGRVLTRALLRSRGSTDVVEERLSVDGELADGCEQAIDRWYGRLGDA